MFSLLHFGVGGKTTHGRLIMLKIMRHTLFSLTLLWCSCSYSGQVLAGEGPRAAQLTHSERVTLSKLLAKVIKSRQNSSQFSTGALAPFRPQRIHLCWIQVGVFWWHSVCEDFSWGA